MSNTFTVILGEQDYTIKKLPARKAAGWRKSLQEPLLKIVGYLSQFSEAGGELQQIEKMDLTNLQPLLQNIIHEAHDGLEFLPDVVLSYSNILKGDQSRIDETATDEEFLAAFIQMVQAAYPFGTLVRQARRLGSTTLAATPTLRS